MCIVVARAGFSSDPALRRQVSDPDTSASTHPLSPDPRTLTIFIPSFHHVRPTCSTAHNLAPDVYTSAILSPLPSERTLLDFPRGIMALY